MRVNVEKVGKLLFRLIFAAALIGCRTRNFSEVKIIGGDVVARTSLPPVVYIATGCSAVVISPNQLLTAGHCVQRYPDYFVVEKGTKLEIDAVAGKPFNNGLRKFQATITGVEIHPSWRDKLKSSGNPDVAADDPNTLDLALITLSGNLPIVPALLNTGGIKAKQNVLLVGAGCDSRTLMSLGTMRQAPLSIDSVSKFKFLIGTRRSDDPNKLAGACEGDSGGGSFLQENNRNTALSADKKWTLLGISSILSAPQVGGDLNQVLSLTAIRTDTEAVATWLKSQTAARPAGMLEDSEPQTVFEAIDRIRASVQDDSSYRSARIKSTIQATPELKDKLGSSRIDELVKILMAPENTSKKSETILKRYL
jgi:hypothetical protein